MKISAVVLTKNEEKNIERCLKSLDFCDEIIIVDDYSTDSTYKQILNFKHHDNQLKIKIFKRKLDSFAHQRNFAQERASGDWILFVDADEEISSLLKKEIVEIKNKNIVDKFVAFHIKRRDFFWGREVKYGEVKEIRQKGLIRLVEKNKGTWIGDVHEQINLININSNLKVGRLKNYINHYPHQTLKEFLKTINLYSSLRAKELYFRGVKPNIFQLIFYPLGKFLLTYFIYFGFLDGVVGFVYSFMMSFHSFLVRAKLFQYYLGKKLS